MQLFLKNIILMLMLITSYEKCGAIWSPGRGSSASGGVALDVTRIEGKLKNKDKTTKQYLVLIETLVKENRLKDLWMAFDNVIWFGSADKINDNFMNALNMMKIQKQNNNAVKKSLMDYYAGDIVSGNKVERFSDDDDDADNEITHKFTDDQLFKIREPRAEHFFALKKLIDAGVFNENDIDMGTIRKRFLRKLLSNESIDIASDTFDRSDVLKSILYEQLLTILVEEKRLPEHWAVFNEVAREGNLPPRDVREKEDRLNASDVDLMLSNIKKINKEYFEKTIENAYDIANKDNYKAMEYITQASYFIDSQFKMDLYKKIADYKESLRDSTLKDQKKSGYRNNGIGEQNFELPSNRDANSVAAGAA